MHHIQPDMHSAVLFTKPTGHSMVTVVVVGGLLWDHDLKGQGQFIFAQGQGNFFYPKMTL